MFWFISVVHGCRCAALSLGRSLKCLSENSGCIPYTGSVFMMVGPVKCRVLTLINMSVCMSVVLLLPPTPALAASAAMVMVMVEAGVVRTSSLGKDKLLDGMSS